MLNARSRLITLYQTLHDNIHAKSGQESTLNLQYLRTERENIMGWVCHFFLCGTSTSFMNFVDYTAFRAVRGYVAIAAEKRACECRQLDRTVGAEGGEAAVPPRRARILMCASPPSPTDMSHIYLYLYPFWYDFQLRSSIWFVGNLDHRISRCAWRAATIRAHKNGG